MSQATVTLNSAGVGEHGTVMSESGYFTNLPLEHADWIVDPAIARRFPAGADLLGVLRSYARLAEAAGRAEQALAAVQSGLEAGMPPDAVLSDVECALAALGEISGRRVAEDVTSRIFSRF